MAPRGRPRKGASRIDAALSAVSELGYPEAKVRAKVKHLLKVYGGDSGYPFIEADAYKVLIEALLEDGDSKEEKASLETLNTGGPSTPIESAGSHTPNTAQVNEGDDDICKTASRSPEKRTTDGTDAFSAEEKLMDSPIPHGVAPPSPPLVAASPPQPPQSIPAQRRKPCYGYIGGEDEEEEEIEFVFLTPMLPGRHFEEQIESSNSETVRRSNRKSRWDVRPEDM